MPQLTPEMQARAEHLMTESLGSVLGIVLLAANDFEDAKANIHKSVDEFPPSIREMLAPREKTDTLIENTKAARIALRELFQILALIDHPGEPGYDEEVANVPSERGSIQEG